MVHKKKCECGFIVSAASAKAAAEAIVDHTKYSVKGCQALNARNI